VDRFACAGINRTNAYMVPHEGTIMLA